MQRNELLKQEHQVFHDPTGKRWKITKVIAVFLIVVLSVITAQLLPRILAPNGIEQFAVAASDVKVPDTLTTPAPETLAKELANVNVPIIGEGPLIRIVHLNDSNGEKVAIEAYEHRVTKVLTESEKLLVRDHAYAIERYGKTADKRIALTFDDGPDQVFTPQILDLLSEQAMPSSFFVTGNNVVKYPELAQRLTKEGHTIANHTFTHINFDLENSFRAEQEITQTGHVIAETTNHSTSFFRPPYGGGNDQAMRDTLRGSLYAQKLGYVNTSYTFDTNDWDASNKNLPALPTFDGNDIVMLLHDAGGDRTKTIAYLKILSTAAREKGYTFVNLNTLYAQDKPLAATTTPTIGDQTSYLLLSAVLVWPHSIIGILFFVSAFSILLSIFINVLLAILQMKRVHYKRRQNKYNPLVSVIVPAYNEDVVLIKTVRSLLKSYYRNVEIIIIDDGSKDDTWKIAQKVAKTYKRVRSFTQKNGGKSSALNNGIKRAKGEIIICIDADTIFPPNAISRMVRHFADPTVGAVAGSVKVGNVNNMITRWQALEYTVGIHLERTAQAWLGAIIVVPGACGAWRKSAVLKAGGFSKTTLAEDCDLTLAIHKAGYRIVQDNSARGYTEAPQTFRSLSKQRFRWIFGNIQSFWKHRDVMFRRQYGWLGMFVMPYALFNILLPFIFIPILLTLLVENLATGQYMIILLFASLTFAIQLIVAIIGVILAKERASLLLAVPMTRLMYSPLKTYLLFATVFTALKGAQVGWNKLKRTGNVRYPKIRSSAPQTPNN